MWRRNLRKMPEKSAHRRFSIISTANLPVVEATAKPITPPFAIKLVFWFILGALSSVVAEVVAASDPYPFFRAWGWSMTIPVYTLHILVLSFFLFGIGKRKVTLPSLFLAGMIFSMYEAYISKVIWNPTFGQDTMALKVGGLAVLQTAILVLFYHPFMSFMIPLFLGENLFTSSSETFQALPRILQRVLGSARGFLWAIGLFAIYCGAFQASGAKTVKVSLTSGSSAVAVLFLLGVIWHWMRRGRNYSLRELLPSKLEGTVLCLLLLVDYLATGFLIRPEALPRTLLPHVTVWAMYAAWISLLYFNIKHSAPWTPTGTSPFRAVNVPAGLLAGVLLVVTSTLFVLFGPNVGEAIGLGSFLVGWCAAAVLLVWGIIKAFSKPTKAVS